MGIFKVVLAITAALLVFLVIFWAKAPKPLSAKNQGIAGLGVVLLFACGIVLFGQGQYLKSVQRFRSEGIEVTARITALNTERSVIIKGSGPSYRLRFDHSAEVSYFTQPDKEAAETSETASNDEKSYVPKLDMNMGDLILTAIPITKSQYTRLKKGEQIPVLYLPDDPEQAMLKEVVYPEGESNGK